MRKKFNDIVMLIMLGFAVFRLLQDDWQRATTFLVIILLLKKRGLNDQRRREALR